MKLSKILVFEMLLHFCPELSYMCFVVLAKGLDEVVSVEEDDSPFVHEDVELLWDGIEA